MNCELLPCPCCGGESDCNNTGCRTKNNIQLWWVECLDCGLSTAGDEIQKEAIAAWNRRHEPENKPLSIEELREMSIGEWVWIQILQVTDNKLKIPAYYCKFTEYTNGKAFHCGYPLMGFDFDYCDYDKTWTAYRHKPKEG